MLIWWLSLVAIGGIAAALVGSGGHLDWVTVVAVSTLLAFAGLVHTISYRAASKDRERWRERSGRKRR